MSACRSEQDLRVGSWSTAAFDGNFPGGLGSHFKFETALLVTCPLGGVRALVDRINGSVMSN